jgi:hypothetical protein
VTDDMVLEVDQVSNWAENIVWGALMGVGLHYFHSSGCKGDTNIG